MKKIFSHTMALCPECKAKIPARIIEYKDKIYIEKFCKQHGLSCALICSDTTWYMESMNYVKPKQPPLTLGVKEYKGCPESCGLCSEHQQHTCLPVIEITSKCNLNCPICLKTFRKSFQISVLEFEKIIEYLFEYEEKIDLINLSGGEPTIHPEFERMLEISTEKGVNQVTVSTNGVELLVNRKLRGVFKQNNAIIALQFDGFLPETYHFLRGKDISLQKLELIRILEYEDIKYSLVATVVKGVNDKEITSIVDFFFNSKALSLMFQPVTFTGKAINLDPNKNRITIPDIVKNIEKSKYVKKGDFNPLPCSHFSCFALAYYLIAEEGNFLSLKEFLGREAYLDLISNKTLPGLDRDGYSLMKEKIYELWSAKDTGGLNDKILARIRKVLKEMNSQEFSPKQAFSIGIESMKAIFIHQFMDIHTLDFGRLMKCCNHYPKPDGRLIPMCAENIFFNK